MQVWVQGIGVLGAGFPDWPTAREVLRGGSPYRAQPAPQPKPDLLPPNERRRGATIMRWSIAAAHEAVLASGLAASELATVFTSSGGDAETLDNICQALARPEREVSPTRFQNSVHNAAAGYWSIAAASRRSSVTLCGHDASFAAGLLEAASEVVVDQTPVLLVACDLRYPEPLWAVRPITAPFAVAMVLVPAANRAAFTRWSISVEPGNASSDFPSSIPPAFRDNPAGRALKLLYALASQTSGSVEIDYVDGCRLVVDCVVECV